MLITFIFIVFIILLSIIIEIRTQQKKRVIIASSGLYAFVLYLVIFDTFKDSSVLMWFIKIRPDLILESLAPNLLKIFTTNPFLENPLLAKLLNALGIREGTKVFNLIKNYRPIAADSPFTGISINSCLRNKSSSLSTPTNLVPISSLIIVAEHLPCYKIQIFHNLIYYTLF